jgi:hypothetical protein
LCQLHDIEARLERRRRSHAALRVRLGSRLYAVPGAEAPLHNIVFTSAPDALVSALKARGVTAGRQYRTISQHPAYRELADRPFPAADRWTDRAVYLPFGMAMTPEDAARVADAVRDADVPLDDSVLPSVVDRRRCYLGSVITSRLLFGGWTVTVFDRLAGSGESLMGFASHLIPARRGRCARRGSVADRVRRRLRRRHLPRSSAKPLRRGRSERAIDQRRRHASRSVRRGGRFQWLVMISTCSNYGVSSPDVLAERTRRFGHWESTRRRRSWPEMVLAHTGRLLTLGLARNDLRTVAKNAFRPAHQRDGLRCGARRRY